MLGSGPVIGVWASISRQRRRRAHAAAPGGGNPTINPFINPDGEKNLFNARQPADDVANYLDPWSTILQNAGGYTPEAARTAALELPPGPSSPAPTSPSACVTRAPALHRLYWPG